MHKSQSSSAPCAPADDDAASTTTPLTTATPPALDHHPTSMSMGLHCQTLLDGPTPTYRTMTVLDSGSFGQALLVQHLASGLLLVVKRPLPQRGRTASLLDRDDDFQGCGNIYDPQGDDLTPEEVRERDKELTEATRELSSLVRLNHNGIVKVFGAWLQPVPFGPSGGFFLQAAKETKNSDRDGRVHIAMEYCPGGNLKQLVTRCYHNRPIPEYNIRSYLFQLLDAMDHTHRHHIMHRDIKPQNIFTAFPDVPSASSGEAHLLPSVVGGADVLKLGDFGLAKIFNTTSQEAGQSVVGTPCYFSPEMMMSSTSGGGNTRKSDVWALGVVVYELMLGGRQLYCATEGWHQLYKEITAESVGDLATAVRQRWQPNTPLDPRSPHPSPRSHAVYSQGLCDMVASMLTKDPNVRPNIRDLLGMCSQLPASNHCLYSVAAPSGVILYAEPRQSRHLEMALLPMGSLLEVSGENVVLQPQTPPASSSSSYDGKEEEYLENGDYDCGDDHHERVEDSGRYTTPAGGGGGNNAAASPPTWRRWVRCKAVYAGVDVRLLGWCRSDRNQLMAAGLVSEGVPKQQHHLAKVTTAPTTKPIKGNHNSVSGQHEVQRVSSFTMRTASRRTTGSSIGTGRGPVSATLRTSPRPSPPRRRVSPPRSTTPLKEPFRF